MVEISNNINTAYAKVSFSAAGYRPSDAVQSATATRPALSAPELVSLDTEA
jgi:hypothetical protein